MFMNHLCKLADDHLTNSKRAVYAHNGPPNRIVSEYYSQPLKQLIRRCRSKSVKDRPDAHALYEATKEKMEEYRAKAYAAEEASRRERYPGNLFHEKVLFSKIDQDLFRENSDFRGSFLEVNLKPVRNAEEKYYMKAWESKDLEHDEHDTSIVTDHHSTTNRRLTAPEARVDAKLEAMISTNAWLLFAEQSINPLVDRLSASVRSEATTADDLSEAESLSYHHS